MAEAEKTDPRIRANDEETTERDYEIAEEIARFIADRAFLLEDHECRAWALTDFEVWANLAGRDAGLVMLSRGSADSGEG